MKTKIFYSDRYYIDFGEHVFPTAKYRLIKEKLLGDGGIAEKLEFVEPIKPGEEDILLVHASEYLDKLKRGTLSYEEMMTLELPYTKELIDGAILFCGGTIGASESALTGGLGIHLGGGFHHAFPDHGEGFCVLNDIAVAIKKHKAEGRIKKALIVDCDLHQGNGTARIFQGDSEVYTFSIHQENNYPFYKPKGDLDIGLRDRTKDKEYLAKLEEYIPKIIDSFRPDILVYVAGADPYEHDKIGNLALTKEGLRKRDYFVSSQARSYQVPLAVVLAGGYAEKQEDTVEIQYNTIKTAIEVFNSEKRK